MGIENRRYEVRIGKGHLLDEIDSFFTKKLDRKEHAIRYAIVDVRKEKVTLEATILEE